MQREVVVVDERDGKLGTVEIEKAHQGKGIKHRALSVILYRRREEKTEILLQKRAKTKPVFQGLWSNTCCTNMRVGDEYLPRAVSRLEEEMGIKIKQKDLRVLYRFSYKADDLMRKGWCENELDTVVVGEFEGLVVPNPEEAEDYRWIEWRELQKEIARNPVEYAPWYKMILRDRRFVREVE